jgi:hypothetical protein
VAGCGECGDKPLGSCATELVSYILLLYKIVSGSLCTGSSVFENLG